MTKAKRQLCPSCGHGMVFGPDGPRCFKVECQPACECGRVLEPGVDCPCVPENREGGQGHPVFLGLLDEMRAMHLRKSADYGVTEDPLANVRASSSWGVPAWVGAMVRANDKVVRLQAAAKGSELVNEGVEDSLMDLAAYALIALVLFREEVAGG